ncbi:c-type cytochrome [Pseudoponticoccus marisrubri]|uniref:Cytochrome C554 n=1 Tax=Pseudoponticoccus marisrubri TaxID=1685382 RepID=A0A0W7WPB9_9RHOB|nr:cytochrome c [Pseudoponticoccus marisrubri]KUF12356.1 cytochrome C554 [Pseudoponticoccus marisrubri]
MKYTFAALAACAVLATPALAQDLPQPVKARQGQFNILALNLGILGGMARGTVEYDADAAQAAADSLVAVTMVDQRAMWPEGTDMESIDGTRALPAAFENVEDVVAKWEALGEAAVAMQAAVGDGQQAIGQNMGAIAGACKDCHDDYRASE